MSNPSACFSVPGSISLSTVTGLFPGDFQDLSPVKIFYSVILLIIIAMIKNTISGLAPGTAEGTAALYRQFIKLYQKTDRLKMSGKVGSAQANLFPPPRSARDYS